MKDIKNGMQHLREHQEYPATRDELVAACFELKDFSDEDKQWFKENLPEGTYKSADEVIQALGWSSPATQPVI